MAEKSKLGGPLPESDFKRGAMISSIDNETFTKNMPNYVKVQSVNAPRPTPGDTTASSGQGQTKPQK